MADALFVLMTGLFFGLATLLVRACEFFIGEDLQAGAKQDTAANHPQGSAESTRAVAAS